MPFLTSFLKNSTMKCLIVQVDPRACGFYHAAASLNLLPIPSLDALFNLKNSTMKCLLRAG